MIDELHVSNIALIEDASISLHPKMTVLTGETGAGKTALLSALRLISGQRGDSKTVREGSEEGIAEARLILGDEEHVLRRRLSAQGRSRCTLDGNMATVGELSTAAESIRIHNQHEQVRLLQPAAQLAYLDDYISSDGNHLIAYSQALESFQQAAAYLEELSNTTNEQLKQLEYQRYVAEAIESVNPRDGEYDQLLAELPRLQHGENLAMAAQGASSALQDDGAALDALSQAAQCLCRQQGIDQELDEMAERLDMLQDELSALARDLSSYRDDLHYDPQTLQAALERLEQLSGLMKRFGPTMDDVFAAWSQANEASAAVATSPQRLEKARRSLEEAKTSLQSEGERLAQLRSEKAREFCALLDEAVSGLAMESASFEFSAQNLPFEHWNARGTCSYELMFRPAPGASAQPLARIASGGELSRILLALECVHAAAVDAAQPLTLVFDEVDSGVGGVAGEAVAQRLSELSQSAQVVVVTHLPQVAALADAHYVVEKTAAADGKLPHTSVAAVDGEARVREIARMMAGDDSAEAIEHARTLLKG